MNTSYSGSGSTSSSSYSGDLEFNSSASGAENGGTSGTGSLSQSFTLNSDGTWDAGGVTVARTDRTTNDYSYAATNGYSADGSNGDTWSTAGGNTAQWQTTSTTTGYGSSSAATTSSTAFIGSGNGGTASVSDQESFYAPNTASASWTQASSGTYDQAYSSTIYGSTASGGASGVALGSSGPAFSGLADVGGMATTVWVPSGVGAAITLATPGYGTPTLAPVGGGTPALPSSTEQSGWLLGNGGTWYNDYVGAGGANLPLGGAPAAGMSWPAAVDAVWAMGFTPDAAPRTALAAANTTPSFTPETISAVDTIFSSVAANGAAFPVMRSGVLGHVRVRL